MASLPKGENVWELGTSESTTLKGDFQSLPLPPWPLDISTVAAWLIQEPWVCDDVSVVEKGHGGEKRRLAVYVGGLILTVDLWEAGLPAVCAPTLYTWLLV